MEIYVFLSASRLSIAARPACVNGIPALPFRVICPDFAMPRPRRPIREPRSSCPQTRTRCSVHNGVFRRPRLAFFNQAISSEPERRRGKDAVPIYRQLRPAPILTPHIGAGDGDLRHGLFIAKLIYFAFFAAMGCLVPFLNIYFAHRGLSGAEIGWLSSIPPLVALMANPLWGAVADKWQIHRYVLATCAFGAGTVSLLLLTANGFWALMAVVVVLSFFRTPIGSLMDSTVIDMTRKVGAHYGRQRVWGSVGFVLVTLSLGQIVTPGNLRMAFWIHGLLLGVVVVALGLRLPIAGRAGQASLLSGLRQLAGRRSYMAFLGAMALLGIGTSGYANFLGLHIMEVGGDERMAGFAWAVNALAEIPMMFLGARWFARFEYSRLIKIGFVGYVVVWLLMAAIQSPWQGLAVAALVGACYGTVWVAAVNYAGQSAPPGLSATAQALVGAANSGVGWGVGSVIAGYLWDAQGGSAVFLSSAVATTFAVLLFMWGTRRELVPAAA